MRTKSKSCLYISLIFMKNLYIITLPTSFVSHPMISSLKSNGKAQDFTPICISHPCSPPQCRRRRLSLLPHELHRVILPSDTLPGAVRWIPVGLRQRHPAERAAAGPDGPVGEPEQGPASRNVRGRAREAQGANERPRVPGGEGLHREHGRQRGQPPTVREGARGLTSNSWWGFLVAHE